MILQYLFLVKGGRRISQNEIRNSAAEKSESESEGGQKFPAYRQAGFPPTTFLFARPSVQFLPRLVQQSVILLFKKGSGFVHSKCDENFPNK